MKEFWPFNNYHQSVFLDIKYCFRGEEIDSQKWLPKAIQLIKYWSLSSRELMRLCLVKSLDNWWQSLDKGSTPPLFSLCDAIQGPWTLPQMILQVATEAKERFSVLAQAGLQVLVRKAEFSTGGATWLEEIQASKNILCPIAWNSAAV